VAFAVIQSAVSMGIVLDEMIGLPPEIILRNGGTRCDMMYGPCACGAWHNEADIYNVNDTKRLYLYYLIVEKDNGKSGV
jgi:hypothetical protein